MDIEEGYYDPFWPDVGRFVSPETAFAMETDTVVVVCEVQNVDSQISEVHGPYGDIGSGPRTSFPEHEDRSDVPDLGTFTDNGPKGPSLRSEDTSDPPVSVGVVDSGPVLPDPELKS